MRSQVLGFLIFTESLESRGGRVARSTVLPWIVFTYHIYRIRGACANTFLVASSVNLTLLTCTRRTDSPKSSVKGKVSHPKKVLLWIKRGGLNNNYFIQARHPTFYLQPILYNTVFFLSFVFFSLDRKQRFYLKKKDKKYKKEIKYPLLITKRITNCRSLHQIVIQRIFWD